MGKEGSADKGGRL